MVTTTITVPSPKIHAPFRIALATDLHSGPPDEALARIQQARPDLIAVAGDLFDTPDDDPANALRFLRECVKIAKTVYTAGNHEEDRAFLEAYHLEDMGVICLENQKIRLGPYWIGGHSDGDDVSFAREFSRLEGYKILLCHRPEYYKRFFMDCDFDLVLSGHAHGGQIRVGNRGLYVPGQGLFAKYVAGLHHNRLVISRGMTNSVPFPRWGNPTEVVIVEIKPQ